MKRHKGFSIIELVVVIVIIAILCGMLVPALGKAREEARKAHAAKTRQAKKVGGIDEQIELFKLGDKVRFTMGDEEITARIIGRKLIDNSTDVINDKRLQLELRYDKGGKFAIIKLYSFEVTPLGF